MTTMHSLRHVTRAARYWALTSGLDEVALDNTPNCSCCGHDDPVPDPAAWQDLYPHLSDEAFRSGDRFVDPPGALLDWEVLDRTCGYDVQWFRALERYSYERMLGGNLA